MDQPIYLKHIYKHFKGKYYYVEGFAKDSETQERMVIYHALYDSFQRWIRPLKMFGEELPIEKQKEYRQQYRFELVNMEGNKPLIELTTNKSGDWKVLRIKTEEIDVDY